MKPIHRPMCWFHHHFVGRWAVNVSGNFFPNNWLDLNGNFQTSDLSAFPANSINIWIMALTSNRLFPPPRPKFDPLNGCWVPHMNVSDGPSNMIKTPLICYVWPCIPFARSQKRNGKRAIRIGLCGSPQHYPIQRWWIRVVRPFWLIIMLAHVENVQIKWSNGFEQNG